MDSLAIWIGAKLLSIYDTAITIYHDSKRLRVSLFYHSGCSDPFHPLPRRIRLRVRICCMYIDIPTKSILSYVWLISEAINYI